MKNTPPKKPRAGRSKGVFGIDDAEWDFCERNIPSNSVHKCLLYEYARELIRRSPEASSTLKKLQAAKSSKNYELVWLHYERLASFMETKNSGSVIIYEYMDEVSWIGFQRLLEKEKQMLIKRKKRGQQPPKMAKGKKTEVSKVIDPNELNDSDDLLYRGSGLVLLKNPPYDHRRLYENFSNSIRAANAVLDTDVRKESCGFFAVDLKATVPDVLADFKSWLDKERKRAGIIDAERRGRTSKTDKAYVLLRALGAYRLMTMTKMSAAGIIDTFQHRLKRPPLYSNAPEWSRAKQTVEATLRNLFIIPEDAIF
jgi:hypothetical protein